jgi:hypothetical protein
LRRFPQPALDHLWGPVRDRARSRSIGWCRCLRRGSLRPRLSGRRCRRRRGRHLPSRGSGRQPGDRAGLTLTMPSRVAWSRSPSARDLHCQADPPPARTRNPVGQGRMGVRLVRDAPMPAADRFHTWSPGAGDSPVGCGSSTSPHSHAWWSKAARAELCRWGIRPGRRRTRLGSRWVRGYGVV